MERLNSDYQSQFFCAIHIRVGNPLSNFKIISEIRTELDNNMNIQGLQKVLTQKLIKHIIHTCFLRNLMFLATSL